MGCTTSQHQVKCINISCDGIKSSVSSEADEIDVNVLFAALLKLSFTFDVKDSMMTSLIDEIRNDRHTCFDDQFVGVEKWIKRHAAPETSLTANEMFYLIRYVDLYEPCIEEEGTMSPSRKFKSSSKRDASYEIAASSQRDVRLMCPYRSDVAAWTAEIRGQEMSKTVQRQYSGTATPSNTTRIFTERRLSGWSMDDLDDSFSWTLSRMDNVDATEDCYY